MAELRHPPAARLKSLQDGFDSVRRNRVPDRQLSDQRFFTVVDGHESSPDSTKNIY